MAILEKTCSRLHPSNSASLKYDPDHLNKISVKSFSCRGKAIDGNGKLVCDRHPYGPCPKYQEMVRAIKKAADNRRAH